MKFFVAIFFFCFAISSNAQEICNNGIDDDGDGLIDLNDVSDCSSCIPAFNIPLSLIPNFSFENTNCCPNNDSQMSCASDWIQASNPTTDYCNTCGWVGSYSGILPLPGNNAYIGFFNTDNWNEYVGVCLSGPLLAGTPYMLNFYAAAGTAGGTIDLSIWGSPTCTDLPFGGNACPSGIGQWQLLDDQNVVFSQGASWQQFSLIFTPSVNINAVALGGGCLTVGGYFYLDQLTLNTVSAFEEAQSSGNWCTNDLVIYTEDTTLTNHQWYLNGIALVGETNDSLAVLNYGAGAYDVTYLDGASCFRANYQIDTPVYPVAAFNPFIDSVCLNESIFLLNDSLASPVGINNWYWDMGDNTGASFSYNQSYTYANSGSYDVSLIVESYDGCIDTLTRPVKVSPLPDVIFEFSSGGINYQVAAGDTVQVCGLDSLYFNNLSTIDTPDIIVQYDWNFSNIATSALINPVYQFPSTGIFDVTLTATSNNGCTDDFECVLKIVDEPIPIFSMVNTACLYTPIVFTNTSIINSGTIMNYSWDFDDQTSSTQANPTHLYANPGIYNVQLITESDEGCIDSVSNSIEIYTVPIADFQVNEHCINETINFIDQSTISAGSITNWEWDLGGTAYNIASPSHIFPTDSTYSIELIVESDQGCLDTLNNDQIIYPIPELEFTAESVCNNEPVEFTNTSTITSGSIQQYNWDLDNGLASNLTIPDPVIYPGVGQYQVQLEAISDQGCQVDSMTMIEIYNIPIAQIQGDPLFGCSPFDVPLFNFTNSDSYNCIWNFGDGTIIENCGSVQNTYGPGIYDVSLVVYSENGCVDSTRMLDFIQVDKSPKADFIFSPTTVTINSTTVNFTNLSVDAASNVWYFSDVQDFYYQEDLEHEFPEEAGTYSVTLTVFNEGQTCYDSIIKTIIIHDEVIFYVPNSFTPNFSGKNDIFLPIITSGVDIYDYKLTIFNRWGEVMFISYDPSVGWDGTLNGNEIKQNGTYIWQIDYEVINKDERQTERGVINLIK